MAKQKKKYSSEPLLEAVVNGLANKKGHDIVVMDFTAFNSAVCNYFVICHGTSNIQTQALAEEVEAHVFRTLGQKVSQREGVQNAEWILLDYFDVIVHVFQEEKRSFYKLEQLWADAPLIDAESFIKKEKKEVKNVKRTTKVKSSKKYNLK